MAQFTIQITRSISSKKYFRAQLFVVVGERSATHWLTKEDLLFFLSRHLPLFSRYSRSLRKYSFNDLCQFVIDQDKYTVIPFKVDVLNE